MIQQLTKSISFPKAFNSSRKNETIKLALNDDNHLLFDLIKEMSSDKLRKILDCDSYDQILQKAKIENRSLNNYCLTTLSNNLLNNNQNKKINLETNTRTGTFFNNKNSGIFGWFPYLEGYSYDFIEDILQQLSIKPKKLYEPFAGSGTTILVGLMNGIECGYSEINPLMQFLLKAKLDAIQNAKNIKDHYSEIDRFLSKLNKSNATNPLTSKKHQYMIEKKYFDETILQQFVYLLDKIQRTKLPIYVKNICKCAVASITVQESNMIRRADLRFKKNNEFKEIESDVANLFKTKVQKFIQDVIEFENIQISNAQLVSENAKTIPSNYNENYDVIITSPPYVNGTNYFRNTKLELLLLNFVESEDDLSIYRDESITAGINNVSKRISTPEKISHITSIIEELELDNYDSRIPKLVSAYFSDMKISFQNFYDVLASGGECFIDIGDSKFKNTHIPADEIFEKIAQDIGFKLVDKIVLRNRFSKDGTPLKQYLLHFKKPNSKVKKNDLNKHFSKAGNLAKKNWQAFKNNQPYKVLPYSKRNWGNSLHSLCSYQGKLKPSIAHFLISMFTEEHMTVLDTFAGVGTIPYEGALQNRKVIGNDLSKVAYANTLAKIGKVSEINVQKVVNDLKKYIETNSPSDKKIKDIDISFNKTIQEYYHLDTFKEIVVARDFFLKNGVKDANFALVFSSLLHILHGNRPYALSRTSHPITPFAPRGDYVYKNLIDKLMEKVTRSLNLNETNQFQYGDMILGDVFDLDKKLPNSSVDSIITSPPFFDSTKFYLANWIRLWFSGWDKKDFDLEKEKYLETKQIKNIEIYDEYFKVCHHVLKQNGTLIMHLGVSSKANMGEMILPYAKKYFDIIGMFIEDVDGSEKFGIRDQGSVKGHQFLFLVKT